MVPGTYRDDLEAAQARAEAADAEAKRLKQEVQRLKEDRKPSTSDAPEVPIPEKFKLDRSANELTVRWRWFGPQYVFMLFFVIAWDAFLVFWYSQAFGGAGGWIFKIFPIAHVAVGIGLTYTTLTGFLNRTTISAQRGTLSVHHGPLPWRGNHEIAIDDLKQLYVNETLQRYSDTHRYANNRAAAMARYDLCALLANGRELRLVRGLETAQQGQFLERIFEERLGIEDRKIAGEVPKNG